MINFLSRPTLAAAAGVALLAGVTAGAVAQQQTAAVEKAEIKIQNFSFAPKALTIKAGTEVTWVNDDEEPHNIVNVGQATRVFRSPGLDGTEKFSFVFEKAGEYDYICSIHPRMEGKIVVQ